MARRGQRVERRSSTTPHSWLPRWSSWGGWSCWLRPTSFECRRTRSGLCDEWRGRLAVVVARKQAVARKQDCTCTEFEELILFFYEMIIEVINELSTDVNIR